MKKLMQCLAIILVVCPTSYANWAVDEGFEGGVIPPDWTIIDYNGDWWRWFAYEDAGLAHTGSWVAVVEWGYGPLGDDWLITPQVSVSPGDSIIFYARRCAEPEYFEVKLSTRSPWVVDFDVTLDYVTGLSTEYVRYAYDLTPYAGEDCYLAIRWLGFQCMVVDDVKVGQEPPVGVEGADWGSIKALYR